MSFYSVFIQDKSQSFHSKAGKKNEHGLGLIDVIVGVAILGVLFLGIFGMFQMSLELIFNSKAKAGAISLLEDRMEYVRSLSYADVGTKNGIPPGEVPQKDTVSLNGIDYERRAVVKYYDASADGTGDDDENGVTTDHKRVKVEVSWQKGGSTKSIEAATYVVPDGVETESGGGTLIINAIDAVGDPVENAEVHIYNASTSPITDVTDYTNASGTVKRLGATSSSNYEITVSKDGYSTAQTYDVTEENQNPDPGHLTVSTSSVTSATFAIDVLSSVDLRTVTPPTNATFTEPYTDTTKIASSSDVAVTNGELQLAETSGTYATNGKSYTQDFGTSTVAEWGELTFSATTTSDTEARFFIVSSSTDGYTKLTNSELSGNESGFTSSPVDLSEIPTSTYDYLSVRTDLTTSDTSTTPVVGDMSVSYTAGRMPLGDVSVDIHGEKTIGTRDDGSGIYKHNFSTTTDSAGERTLDPLEWDTYHVIPSTTSSDRIASACPPLPLYLSPATTTDLSLAIAEATKHTLRVTVLDGSDASIKGAKVKLSRTNFQEEGLTGKCGQVLFTDLNKGTPSGNDAYSLEVGAEGYSTTTVSDVEVNGASQETVILLSN